MSAQFGKCNFDGKPVDPQDLDEVRPVLAPYGPDGEGYICKDNVGVLYRAFHATRESRREIQPHVSLSGVVLTWDGRLDNREELLEELNGQLSKEPTDLEVVSASYEKFGNGAFARLVGDWAMSIWNPKDQSLLLATDFLGLRHLYYSIENEHVTWCTILDPLVLSARRSCDLEEEYIAGWLSLFPAPHLTPYVGIHAVPPSSYVRLARAAHKAYRYWDFNPANRIRYSTDREYEEHFRATFSGSVRRRLRCDTAVLAELSGGMDSASIVCTADVLIGRDGISDRRVDTISYYDDLEPNWNERPYFTKVEEKRGRVGCHISCGTVGSFSCYFESERFAAAPTSGEIRSEAARQFAARIRSGAYSVLLSGIGGDEVTGGLPTPIPELADLLVSGHVLSLARQLKHWALNKRKPWFHLLRATISEFCPVDVLGLSLHTRPLPWLKPGFAHRNHSALTGYPKRLSLSGAPPSFQENLASVDALRRQVACTTLPIEPCYEKRYPFLDRDFLEFMFAIPPEQVIRPGQRRSLMRRALAAIVPDEVLDRKRKAFVARAPRTAIADQSAQLMEISWDMHADALGFVSASDFRTAIKAACKGLDVPVVALMRTVALELWLRSLHARSVCKGREPLRTVPLASAART